MAKDHENKAEHLGNCLKLALSAIACMLLALPHVAHGDGRLSIKLVQFHYELQHSSDRLLIRLHLGRTLDSTGSHRNLRPIFIYQSDDTQRAYHLDSASQSVVFGDFIDSRLTNPFHVDMNDTKDPSVIVSVEIRSARPTLNLNSSTQPIQATFGAVINPVVRTAGANGAEQVETNSYETDNSRLSNANQTKLTFVHWFTCLPGSYGSRCERLCIEQDSDALGHYTCQGVSGDKVCRAGWTQPDSDCKQSAVPNNETKPVNQSNNDSAEDKTLIIVFVSMSLAVLGVVGIGLLSLFSRSSGKDSADHEPSDYEQPNDSKRRHAASK